LYPEEETVIRTLERSTVRRDTLPTGFPLESRQDDTILYDWDEPERQERLTPAAEELFTRAIQQYLDDNVRGKA
jgi:hypothetical protein